MRNDSVRSIVNKNNLTFEMGEEFEVALEQKDEEISSL